MSEGIVEYSFVRNFRGSNAILFTSDGAGMRNLARALRQVAQLPLGAETSLDTLGAFHHEPTTQIQVHIANTPSRAEATVSADGTTEVRWTMREADARECANAVHALASAGRSAHQYLEKAGNVQIVASVAEYEPKLHG